MPELHEHGSYHTGGIVPSKPLILTGTACYTYLRTSFPRSDWRETQIAPGVTRTPHDPDNHVAQHEATVRDAVRNLGH